MERFLKKLFLENYKPIGESLRNLQYRYGIAFLFVLTDETTALINNKEGYHISAFSSLVFVIGFWLST